MSEQHGRQTYRMWVPACARGPTKRGSWYNRKSITGALGARESKTNEMRRKNNHRYVFSRLCCRDGVYCTRVDVLRGRGRPTIPSNLQPRTSTAIPQTMPTDTPAQLPRTVSARVAHLKLKISAR